MTIFRRAPAGPVASGVFVLGLFYAAGAVTYAAPVTNEVMLVNAKTGKCLTIAGGVSTDNNVESVQFNCDSDPSRRWTLNEMTGGNIYQIKNVQTGKCLTIAGGESTDNNVTALQFDCDSHPSRTWRISDVTGSGVNQIRNVQTNKCLTIAGGESTDQQRPRPAVQLRHRSVAPLDDQAEAVGGAHQNAKARSLNLEIAGSIY